MVKLRDIYLPKIPAFFSIIGSTIIALEVIQDIKLVQASVISRIILSVSIGDIIWSLGWLIGTWLSPRHLTGFHGTNHGTYGTCVFHGFIQEVGVISSVFMNSSLAILYLLIVKYNYREQALKKLEIWIQPGIWLFALVCGIIPIFLEMYHNTGPICWVESYPKNCVQSWEISLSSSSSDLQETTCTMGDNSIFVNLAIGMIPVWSCIFVDTVIMCIIVHETRRIERNNTQYGSSALAVTTTTTIRRTSIRSSRTSIRSGEERARSFWRSRMVAQQAILYISGFLITYGLSTVSLISFLVTSKWNAKLDTASYFFLGCQGILNIVIFSRTRDMKTTVGQCFRNFFWDSCFIAGVCSVFDKIKSIIHKEEESDKNESDENEHGSGTGQIIVDETNSPVGERQLANSTTLPMANLNKHDIELDISSERSDKCIDDHKDDESSDTDAPTTLVHSC